jgi:hypothetical protein
VDADVRREYEHRWDKDDAFWRASARLYIFDASGRFPEIIDNPDKDTNVNYFGTYSANDDGESFVLHIVGSSATRFNGTDVKRDVISISDDGMQLHNPTASLGGSAISTLKRAK